MDLAGCFIKFGQLEHLTSFVEKGILYCNTINYFAGLEDKKIRGDENENVVDMVYMESGEIILGKPEEDPVKNGIQMPFRDLLLTGKITEPFGNLYCLYKINFLEKPIGETFYINTKMSEFGEYFVLIHEPHEFLRRVKQKLTTLGLSFEGNPVQYLDLSKYTGKKSVFQKGLEYEYQQEYRIYIKNKTANPLSIEIGCIEDISILCESTNIESIQFKAHMKDDKTYTVLSNLKPK